MTKRFNNSIIIMSAIQLWGAESPRSFRAIWVLEELGLEYQHHPIQSRTGETQTPEYTNLTRKQKIPFCIDGNIKLSESLAICRYLIRTYPNTELSPPETSVGLAKEDEWCSYIYGEVDQTGLYVMRRHGELADIYGGSETVVNASKDYVARHFGVIDHHLRQHETLAPDGFGLADIVLVSCIDWAAFYQVDIPSNLQSYKERMAQRPAYQKAMQLNYPILFGGAQ